MMKMNKLIVPAAVAAVALSACAHTKPAPENAPQIGTANPASAFCEQQGGKSEIKRDKDGNEYGVCVFSNDKEVDEWEYYRANNKQ